MFRNYFSRIVKIIGANNKITSRAIANTALAVLIALSSSFIWYYVNSLQNINLNHKLSKKYEQPSTLEKINATGEDTSVDADVEGGTSVELTPASHYPDGMLQDFYSLYDSNSDVKGWITIPHTVVNYPVVQSNDNDFYLNRNFNRADDKYGSLFLDYRNQVNVQSKNMIIYGHNMKDGQMFQSIVHYQEPDFYKASSLITFNTLYGHYLWKVFAAFIANVDPKDGYVFNYIVPDFTSDEDFKSFIKEVRARSLINTPSIEVVPGDTILTLSTCYYSLNDARFVVMARRVRPGESTGIGPAAMNNKALSATSLMHD